MVGPSQVKKLLYQSRYREIVERSQHRKIAESDASTLIGALCFLGKWDEAETIYKRYPKLAVSDRVEARFFLGLAAVRSSQYGKARAYFGANLKERRKRLDSKTEFYAHQGIAFYRYFCGKYEAGLRAATCAFDSAWSARFSYGKILAHDLKGHLLTQLHDVHEGLVHFEEALSIAQQTQNISLADAIETSILLYRSQFGHYSDSIERIRDKIESLRVEDTYSRPNLLLELARQYTLRGQARAAEQSLNQASSFIYKHRNRRQEAILNLRWGQLSFLSGEFYRALSYAQSAERCLDLQVDHAWELATLGLQLKVVRHLDMPDQQADLLLRLERESARFGGSIHRRMLHREAPGRFPSTSASRGDQIAHFLETPTIENCIRHGYLVFAYELLQIHYRERTLCIDSTLGHHWLFDRGEVRLLSGLTHTSQKLLMQLAQGPRSKEALTRAVWNYRYHPLQHDPLVYNAVLSLRKSLSSDQDWIETTEDGYRLRADIRLRVTHEPEQRVATKLKTSAQSRLNFRQLQWLSRIQAGSFTHVKQYQNHFKTSEITASRDLANLCQAGYLTRVGRARATRYVLNPPGEKR